MRFQTIVRQTVAKLTVARTKMIRKMVGEDYNKMFGTGVNSGLYRGRLSNHLSVKGDSYVDV